MTAVAKDMAQMDLKTYSILFGGVTIGFVKDVDPTGLKLITVKQTVQEIGDNVTVDEIIVGVEGLVKLKLQQVNLATMKAVMPWASGSGSIPLAPTTPTGKYALSNILSIHPNGNPDASEDINLLHAFPTWSPPKGGDGKTWRELDVDFEPFPDRTLLVANTSLRVWGYIGAIPS